MKISINLDRVLVAGGRAPHFKQKISPTLIFNNNMLQLQGTVRVRLIYDRNILNFILMFASRLLGHMKLSLLELIGICRIVCQYVRLEGKLVAKSYVANVTMVWPVA
jgi:hypothetical protein